MTCCAPSLRAPSFLSDTWTACSLTAFLHLLSFIHLLYSVLAVHVKFDSFLLYGCLGDQRGEATFSLESRLVKNQPVPSSFSHSPLTVFQLLTVLPLMTHHPLQFSLISSQFSGKAVISYQFTLPNQLFNHSTNQPISYQLSVLAPLSFTVFRLLTADSRLLTVFSLTANYIPHFPSWGSHYFRVYALPPCYREKNHSFFAVFVQALESRMPQMGRITRITNLQNSKQ